MARSHAHHGNDHVAIDGCRNGQIGRGHVFIRLVRDFQHARADHHARGTGIAEMDQIARALKAEWPRVRHAIGPADLQAFPYNGMFGRCFDRAARRGAEFKYFRPHPFLLIGTGQQVHDPGPDRVLVLARDHAPV